MATVRLDDLLAEMVERNASDMFMKAGVAPHMRVDGKIISMDYDELNMDDVQAVAYGLMTEEQIHRFEKVPEMDLAMGVRGVGRFRVNLFRQRGSIGMVFRHVKSPTFNFGDLLLPDSVRMLSEKHRGLVLVTGTTGSGKSTTLAAMINHINETRKCHIVTIEDPIEFLHSDKTAIISQREVGFDTKTFADALRHVLRQAPDVILVGEMRDLETVGTSISAAETGHLVLSTLRTRSTRFRPSSASSTSTRRICTRKFAWSFPSACRASSASVSFPRNVASVACPPSRFSSVHHSSKSTSTRGRRWRFRS
jgi:twitching motility protein PilT